MKFWILLASLMACTWQTETYRILIAPYFAGFNSRLLNMQKMADMLALDGHEVSVLMNNRVKNHIITKHASVVSFDIPGNVTAITDLSMEELNYDGFSYVENIKNLANAQISFCESMFQNKRVMTTLKDSHFELVIADMFSLCNNVLTTHLNTTTIWYQNYGFFPDMHGFFPHFPSFTCLAIGTFCVSDDMTFSERVLNAVFHVATNYIFFPTFMPAQYKLAEDAGLELGNPIEEALSDKVIIINVDYVLDTPRPTMPHIFTFSGLFHKKPSPLSLEFQNIIDQSGKHGVVLLSFGTLVPKFDTKTAEIFARVLGRLEQQVIWRYIGDKPRGLQKNTHLMEWFPQNDLLANPAVKLFITHCGISSTFESAYNGVPVVAMPLFADQTYNAKKLSDRIRMGIELDYYNVKEDDFEAGINEVLSNPVYRENAKRASLVMSDQLVPPVERFKHLVNFTVKTEGAKHLFHPYAVRMSWFTFYGLDVLSFLLFILLGFLLVTYMVCKACYKVFFRSGKSKEKKS